MLQPKKRKYAKEFRGKMGGVATANNKVDFGDYGLKAMENGWINAREIEAARRAVAGFTKRKGKTWIKIFQQESSPLLPQMVVFRVIYHLMLNLGIDLHVYNCLHKVIQFFLQVVSNNLF